MQLAIYPADVLRTPTKRITDFSKIPTLTNEMLSLMEKSKGVGLAAPQVGESLKMFVVSESGKAKDGICMINPIIMDYFGDEYDMEEGCLSLPKQRVVVRRWSNIKIKFQNANGEGLPVYEINSMLARIIQHEYDHLFSRLIIDYIKSEQ